MTEETILYRFVLRRDTADNWWNGDAEATLLKDGEIGLETDTKKFKIGDGNTPWRMLPYAGIGEFNLDGLATGSILTWTGSEWVTIDLAGLASGTVLTWDGTNWIAEQPQLRDTAANFATNNPVLRAGRTGYETDTHRAKIGDGTTAYNSLPYVMWGRINLTALAVGAVPTWDGAEWVAEVPHDEGDDYETIYAIFDGGGADIPVGKQCEVICDFPCEIQSYSLMSPDTGSIVIDVWALAYAAYPPSAANSIAAAAKPNLVAQSKKRDLVLTGWTKTISNDTVFRFNVDSCAGITYATLQIKIRRTN